MFSTHRDILQSLLNTQLSQARPACRAKGEKVLKCKRAINNKVLSLLALNLFPERQRRIRLGRVTLRSFTLHLAGQYSKDSRRFSVLAILDNKKFSILILAYSLVGLHGSRRPKSCSASSLTESLLPKVTVLKFHSPG